MHTRYVIATSLLLSSCVAPHRPLPPPVPQAETTRTVESPPTPVSPPIEAEFLDPTSPEVTEAFQRYMKTGKAPLISKKASGFVIFPYGLSQPTVSCRPLELCDIELAPGEEVLDFAAGDQVRWQFQPLREGAADKRIIHIMAKPTDVTSDMQTTIVIGTNQRTYRIRLISRLHGGIINAKFYYPEEMVRKLNEGHAQRPTPAPVVNMAAVLATRNEYVIEGDEAFRPSMMGNDGTRTYFLMPMSLHTMAAPVLFEISPNGKRTQINYRLVDGYYTADKLLEKAALVWGVGNEEQVVIITRTVG